MTLVTSTAHDFTASPLAFYGVRSEAEAVQVVEKIDREYKRGLILRHERDFDIAAVLDFAVPTDRITALRKQYKDEAAALEAARQARMAERRVKNMLPLSA